MRPLLYDAKSAAQALRISPRQVAYYLDDGAFPNTRRIGGRVLIPHSDLVRFAGKNHAAPTRRCKRVTLGLRRVA